MTCAKICAQPQRSGGGGVWIFGKEWESYIAICAIMLIVDKLELLTCTYTMGEVGRHLLATDG
jgi:hypothetical protein